MNVASLENCKRLYELSGNKVDGFHNYYYDDNGHVRRSIEGAIWSGVPAYSAGYLLRKLPSDDFRIAVLTNDSNRWVANRTTANTVEQQCESDTPEDALCLLAIKLFEEGVLK